MDANSSVRPVARSCSPLVVAAIILALAIILVIYGHTRPLPRHFQGQLAEIIPPAPAGWTRTLRPIADTPEMQKAVGELLNFDDGVSVDYTRGTDRFSVYIAYWKPGKMSHRLVAGHTPDVCWVGAGWRCTARGLVNLQIEASSSPMAGDSSRLPPAETRTFIINDTTEYVWFWHLVGGKSKSYGTGGSPPWYASLRDMLQKGLNQREEQFFIRLSSPQQLDATVLAPVLEAVLRALPLLDASR